MRNDLADVTSLGFYMYGNMVTFLVVLPRVLTYKIWKLYTIFTFSSFKRLIVFQPGVMPLGNACSVRIPSSSYMVLIKVNSQ